MRVFYVDNVGNVNGPGKVARSESAHRNNLASTVLKRRIILNWCLNPRSYHGCDIDIALSRRTLFLGLGIAIYVSCSIIFFAETNSREFYSNWIIIINASIASSLAIFVVYKLKFHGDHGRTHTALAVGLMLWLSADIVWAVYQLVLDIVPPMPSVADYL